MTKKTRVNAIRLTQAGAELFPLVDLGNNPAYAEKFIPWVEATFGLTHVTA